MLSITLEQMLERSVLDDSASNAVDAVPPSGKAAALTLVPSSRVRRLRTALSNMRTTARRVAPIERRFECDAGSIGYVLYAPAIRTGGEASLVVMLHGAGQDATDFAAGTRMHAHADAVDTWVLYPSQSHDVPLRCWSWFAAHGQTRGHGEAALLAALTRSLVAEHDISPRRVYAAGLSAGAAMAIVLGQTYPDVFAAIGSHSGLPYGAAADVFAALEVMARGPADVPRPRRVTRIPTIVLHGDADRTVHPDNAHAIIDGLLAGGASARPPRSTRRGANGGDRAHTTITYRDSHERDCVEHWIVHDGGHAWFGGSADGSHTDPSGPDAAGAMLRFFHSHRLEPRCTQQASR
jgi:poly(hydroxyalkanoate) depolymerase family esterase